MAHEEIYRELEECRVSGEFVAYHKWGGDPSIFLVGIVRDLTPTKATFQDVDPRGVLKEIGAVPLRLIHTLDRGTLYLWRLRTLYELGPSVLEERDVRKPAGVRALLEQAAREGTVVRVWTSAQEADEVRVLSVGEETATLSSVYDAGPPNGRTTIRLKRIVRVRWGPSEADDTRVYRQGLEYGFPEPFTDPLARGS